MQILDVHGNNKFNISPAIIEFINNRKICLLCDLFNVNDHLKDDYLLKITDKLNNLYDIKLKLISPPILSNKKCIECKKNDIAPPEKICNICFLNNEFSEKINISDSLSESTDTTTNSQELEINLNELQKFKRKKFTLAEKNVIWNKDCEHESEGKCKACNGKIYRHNFEVGHIMALAMGGSNQYDNLTVICGPCNKSLGTKNLQDFKNELGVPY